MKKIVSLSLFLWAVAIGLMAQTVEVKYFHGQQRCVTCRSIEQQTRELLEDSYAKECKEGKIIFTVIDCSTEEGKRMASEYKVTYSSLFVEKGGKRVNLTQTGFQYAKNQPAEFKKHLKAAIDQYL